MHSDHGWKPEYLLEESANCTQKDPQEETCCWFTNCFPGLPLNIKVPSTERLKEVVIICSSLLCPHIIYCESPKGHIGLEMIFDVT